MQHSFFFKYYEYKNGVRFIIKEKEGFQSFLILHDKEPKAEDEVFKHFDGIEGLRDRLQSIFGEREGEKYFLHLFQDIFQCLESYRKRKKSKKRKK
jgi:hypothetical protein